MKLTLDEMILYEGDAYGQHGITAAFLNHTQGKTTQSSKDAIWVRWIKEEKKYLVVDGYHRIIKGLLEGQTHFRCKIDWFGKRQFWLPPKDQRFKLDLEKK